MLMPFNQGCPFQIGLAGDLHIFEEQRQLVQAQSLRAVDQGLARGRVEE